MSVDSVSGEGTEFLPFYDGEIGWKDYLNEKVSGCAREVIHFNSYLRQSLELNIAPLHPGEYGQTRYKFQEVICRFFWTITYFPTWMGTLPFAMFASVISSGLNLVRSNSYNVSKGDFKGELNQNPKTFLLNPHMLTGATPQKEAGLTVSGDRYDRLVSTIRDNNPDVAFLPEVNRYNAPALISDLKDRYHFFFSGMGERMVGEDASFFIAFRGNLIRPPEFLSSRTQEWFMGKGSFIMETEERVYACMYRPSKEDWSDVLNREFGKKEVILMGEMDPANHVLLEEKGFRSMIPKDREVLTTAPYEKYHGTDEGKPTTISFFYMNCPKGKTDVVPMHDPEKISEALSDHALILHR